MTDKDALLAAIIANPDEDTPRLMYADEIEGDEPERAEFVRVQCELARRGPCPATIYHLSELEEGGHPWKMGGPPIIQEKKPCGWCPACVLRTRERELFASKAYGECPAGLIPVLSADYFGHMDSHRLAILRRGFASEIRCDLRTLFGGSCERCHGHGRLDPRQFLTPRLEYRPPAVPTCPACDGTGRTTGIAADVFRRHPTVTAVRLVGKEPLQIDTRANPSYPYQCRWFRDRENGDDLPYYIPIYLWPHLETVSQGMEGAKVYNFRSGGDIIIEYASPADAHAALSRACVSEGRRLARG